MINRDHPDNGYIKISQNTEKNPGDLGRLAVTRTPVKNLLTLVWKTRKENNNNNNNNNDN